MVKHKALEPLNVSPGALEGMISDVVQLVLCCSALLSLPCVQVFRDLAVTAANFDKS